MTQYFLSIFFGTFILEDVALAASLVLVAKGQLEIGPAFLACFLGIAVGDILIYLLGSALLKLQLKSKWKFLQKFSDQVSRFLKPQTLTYYIVMSRFVPGTRVLTYLCAGFLQFSFWKFVVLTFVSVFGWVLLAFVGGRSIQLFLSENWIISLIALLVLFHIFKTLIPKLANPWDRKVLFNSWRKWLYFEFWPAWFFYIPIYVYYFLLSIKTKSFFTPFYANPEVLNGGLLGESKWDFLKYLSDKNPTTLRTFLLKPGFSVDEIGFSFPFIIKPDVGQRGFGVRIIRSREQLIDYVSLAPFDLIVQELSPYQQEAGLFYVRLPGSPKGFLYSITDKEFPFVVGDGKTKLGDLILNDKRARIMAGTYFERLRANLDHVLGYGEVQSIAECGNHCQGAIFKNGNHLKTPALESAIEEISKRIPNFYFGRFDVRYESHDLLKRGENFHIVEVNGAGAEATHIWDKDTRLIDAYISLWHQWKILFSIGQALKAEKNLTHKVRKGLFFRESLKVFSRKNSLSTSS